MTYNEAQDFIAYAEGFGSRLGLDAIRELLKRLANPQDKRPVVHIAGTNGKGSIFAFLDAILREGGYRVGRYISPTLFTYLERFMINGVSMDEETFARLAERVQAVCRAMADEGFAHPTAFEVETAIAFLYFSEENVDIILLETGMGGREDATNVVAKPIATVFSSISRDHMAFLGDSIALIAREKAGIMRERVPVVLAPMDDTARGVLLEHAEVLCANVVDVGAQEQSLDTVNCDGNGSTFVYEGQRYHISLSGMFQIDNAKTAIAVCRVIQPQFPLREEQIVNGLAKARWAGRFEIMRTTPYTLLRDGAHNPDAARRLKESLLYCFPDCRYHFILGMYRDKEHDVVLRELLPIATSLTAVTPPNPKRALPAEQLFQEAQAIAEELQLWQTSQPVALLLGEPLETAQEQLKQHFSMDAEDVVIVCGSLSLAQIMGN
jgi:dihydrofolate synthase/folylpolyglutamate synthase